MIYLNNPRLKLTYPVLIHPSGWVAQVRTFPTYEDYQTWLTNFKGEWAQVPANRIAILFCGNLEGKIAYPGIKQEVNQVLSEMAGYYAKEILKTNKDYLI